MLTQERVLISVLDQEGDIAFYRKSGMHKNSPAIILRSIPL